MSEKKLESVETESTFANPGASTICEGVDDRIRFEDDLEKASPNSFPKGGSKRKRRLSFHSGDASRDQLFSLREKVEPEFVLPTVFKTVSHRVENEIEKENEEADLKDSWDSTAAKFLGIEYHTLPASEIAPLFNSDLEKGLSETQFSTNLKQFGTNEQSKPPRGLLKKVFMYFFGGFGALLLTGGILCIICWKPLGEPNPAVANLVLGVILLVVFALQALFNFFQDYSSSRVMDSIHNMIPTETMVIRNGSLMSVDSKNLVPGDVIKFVTGDKIPADIRISRCSPDLAFDRSILTGESASIPATHHADQPNSNYLESASIAMQGTFVISGNGMGIVVATGDETIFGSIAKMTSKPKKGLTPLQWEILRFVLLTSTIIVTLAVLIIVLWCAWLRKDHPGWISVSALIVDIVSVAVAFIPEGLPIALTTCLVITANQMRKNKILCKSLSVIETLGSISVLCFDKTGTITKNDMAVTDVSKGTKIADMEDELKSLDESTTHLLTIATLCNDTSVSLHGSFNGNATDIAVFKYANSIKEKCFFEQLWEPLFELSFNSKDKYMAKLMVPNEDLQSAEKTMMQIGLNIDNNKGNNSLLMVKGAPDILLERCNYVLQPTENGVFKEEMNHELKSTLKKCQKDWSSRGKRVILLASKMVKQENFELGHQFSATEQVKDVINDGGLTLVGLIGIEDPPRKGIDLVIGKLRDAGIRIVMITGDFELTGLSIAQKVGIVTMEVDNFEDLRDAAKDCDSDFEFDTKNEKRSSKANSTPSLDRAISITGKDIPKLTEEQWARAIEYKELVFTRTTPEQKLLIIKQFQKHGAVIGMTGDGVNDSPSLKQADIGISLINASEIAKEACDLLLMDDGSNGEDQIFNSIIEALKFGRLVFENLRKTIGYLLPAGTYSELWPVLLNVIFGMPQMLSSFCMIIICCITDCAGAIILAYETNEKNLLQKKPRSITKERLVDFKLLLHSYFTIGTFYTFTSMLLAFLNLTRAGLKFSDFDLSYGSYENLPNVSFLINRSSSIYFVNLVIMQFFNLMAMRTRYLSMFQHSPLENKLLFAVIPFGLAATFIINYIPAIQNGLGTAQVPVEYYFISVGFGAVVLIYDELRKWCNRKHPNGPLAKIAW